MADKNDDIKVVAIGGGTGLPTLLKGLRNHTSNITAVVTVADDGGGSGILREDLGILPPGDIRNCILSLSNKDSMMNELFGYRFSEGLLKGQSFGNLLIAAMAGMSKSFEEAVLKVGEMFEITGKVLPVSSDCIELVAKLENQKIIVGESNIPYGAIKYNSAIDIISTIPSDPRPVKGVVDEIESADIVLIGPGSLYTSVIPNILVKEVDNAIAKSGASKVFVCNLMTQPGETDGMSVGDHVRAFYKHSAHRYIDYVIVNDEKSIAREVLDRYVAQSSYPIRMREEDAEYLLRESINIICGNYIEDEFGYLRHDSHKLSEDIMKKVAKNKK